VSGVTADPPEVERLRAGYAVWNDTGDVSGLLAELDPEVEIVLPDRAPEGPLAFHGHEGAAEWARGMGEVWRDLRFEPLEIEARPADRRALVVVRVTTTGRASDMGLEGTEAHVVTFGADGKVTRIQGHVDVDAARAVFEGADPGL
jgi:ketosteroid isomerase-like protein